MNIRLAAPILFLTLAACSDSPAPAKAPEPVAASASKVKNKPAEADTPAPSANVPYAYNPVGKRDPFRSPTEELRRASKDEGSACDEPLCQWSLDQLTLVAVVTGDSNPMAMVEDPSGQGFIVRRNTKIGKQGGRVTNILRDSVIVTEFWQKPDSKERVANPVTLKLHADDAKQGTMELLSGKLIE